MSGGRSMASYGKEENGDGGGMGFRFIFASGGSGFYTLDRARELGWLSVQFIVIQLLEYVEVCIAVCSKHGAEWPVQNLLETVRRAGKECDTCR